MTFCIRILLMLLLLMFIEGAPFSATSKCTQWSHYLIDNIQHFCENVRLEIGPIG